MTAPAGAAPADARRALLLDCQDHRRLFIALLSLGAAPADWAAVLVGQLDTTPAEVSLDERALIRAGLLDEATPALPPAEREATVEEAGRLARSQPDRAAKFLYGAALDLGEDVLDVPRWGDPVLDDGARTLGARHLQHLVGRGYRPSPVELDYCGLTDLEGAA